MNAKSKWKEICGHFDWMKFNQWTTHTSAAVVICDDYSIFSPFGIHIVHDWSKTNNYTIKMEITIEPKFVFGMLIIFNRHVLKTTDDFGRFLVGVLYWTIIKIFGSCGFVFRAICTERRHEAKMILWILVFPFSAQIPKKKVNKKRKKKEKQHNKYVHFSADFVCGALNSYVIYMDVLYRESLKSEPE